MKAKSLLAAALLTVSTAMMAQKPLVTINSVDNTRIEAYDGQTKDVSMSRVMFHGWNTLCLPVSLTADEVKAAFGEDCKLEALASVTGSGQTIYLNFQSADEVKANTPYIIYYNKEDGYARIKATDAKIEYVAEPKQTATVGSATVSLIGAVEMIQPTGKYGIYAKDNAETKFVKIEEGVNTRFLATRCYLSVEGIADPTIVATHNATQAKQSKSSRMAAKTAEEGSETYTINGMKTTSDAKGIKIKNGKKYSK